MDTHLGHFVPICEQCAAIAGYITTDSSLAKRFGFISTQFSGYLWLYGKTIFVNTISVSINQQNNEQELYYNLFNEISKQGYKLRLIHETVIMEKAAAQIGYKKGIGIDPYLNIPYRYLEIIQP